MAATYCRKARPVGRPQVPRNSGSSGLYAHRTGKSDPRHVLLFGKRVGLVAPYFSRTHNIDRQLNEDGENAHGLTLSKPTIVSEAMLALIAGSDTTGTALANAMFYLMTHQECLARLRIELDAAAGEGAAYDVEIEIDKLAELKYLQAVINETLRLQPAVPNGVQRTPPEEGGPVLVAGQ
jgi:hypothetical protein